MVRMDPGSTFARHVHPEDQLSYTLRGSLVQGVMDRNFTSSDEGNHVLYLPGGMVHSATMSGTGADQFDVFWPVRPDYIERAAKQQALFEEVIAPGARPQKLAEGFTFAEGPTWIDGKLYFSRVNRGWGGGGFGGGGGGGFRGGGGSFGGGGASGRW